jgi:hypothetical protein
LLPEIVTVEVQQIESVVDVLWDFRRIDERNASKSEAPSPSWIMASPSIIADWQWRVAAAWRCRRRCRCL